MRTPPSRPIALGMLAAGALAGCGASASVSVGGSPTVNAPSMRKTLADQIQRQARSRPTVSCPTGEKAAVGRQFTCNATRPDGTTATVLVTLTDSHGRFDARILPPASASPGGAVAPAPNQGFATANAAVTPALRAIAAGIQSIRQTTPHEPNAQLAAQFGELHARVANVLHYHAALTPPASVVRQFSALETGLAVAAANEIAGSAQALAAPDAAIRSKLGLAP